MNPPAQSRFAAIACAAIVGGVFAGTIDVLAASLISQLSPLVVLRAIASGIFGKGAFAMGSEILMLGLLLQWVLSILIGAIYAIMASHLGALVVRWKSCGLAFGAGIYVVMNYIVLPLSAAPFGAPKAALSIVENFIAMLAFGEIVAGATAYYFRRHQARRPYG